MFVSISQYLFFFFFFFQAEDGIRDLTVTGVQTCALPISSSRPIVLPDIVPVMAQSSSSRLRYGLDEVTTHIHPMAVSLGLSLFAANGEIGRASCRERV